MTPPLTSQVHSASAAAPLPLTGLRQRTRSRAPRSSHPARQRWKLMGDAASATPPAARAAAAAEAPPPPTAAEVSGVVDTHELLSSLLRELRVSIRDKRLDVSLRLLARQYRTPGDGERTRQVLRGILRSAIGASRPGGRITVRTTCPSDNALRVEVEEMSRSGSGG